jgi:uncharacterized protein (TIGR02588 family)
MARATRSRSAPAKRAAAAKPAPSRKPAAAAAAAAGETPWLEWLAAGVGLVLIVGVVGVIAREAATVGDGPPVIAVRADRVTRTPSGFVVDVTATNSGDKTAAGVVIEGELGSGPQAETSETTLDYLPAGSQRRAGLMFEGDPRTASLALRAKGFVEP